MKFKRLGKVFSVVFLAVLGLCLFAQAEEEGPKQLKVKGIYMGMDMEEAKKICGKYMDDSMAGEQATPDQYIIFQQGAFVGVLISDPQKKLTTIALTRPLVDNMFNVSGMPVKEFAAQFVSAYHIPSMEYFREEGDAGWRFTSPHGYRVDIFKNGQLTIEKIAKRDSLTFD